MRFFKGVKHLFVPHSGNAYRPYLLRRPALLAFLGIILGAEAFLLAALMGQGGPNFLAAVIHSDIVSLTNTERSQLSLAALQDNALLNAAAQAKADDMAAKGYFSHAGPDGKQPWAWFDAGGYDYRYAGENLAVRFNDSKEVVVAWMASPTHRANIVKPNYTEIGVGISHGMYQGQQVTFVVQFFGAPAAVAVQPPVVSEPSPEMTAIPAAAPEAPTEVAGAQSIAASALVEAPVVSAPAPVPAHRDSGNSVTRQLARMFSEPTDIAAVALGTTLAILVLLLALAFFLHIQVQPVGLLAPGVLVALIAVTFLTVNSRFISETPGQPASVVLSGADAIIGSGTSTER